MQIICRAFAFLEKFAAVFVNAEILTQSVGLIAGADIFIAVGLAIFRILTFGVFGGTVRTGTAAPHAHLLFLRLRYRYFHRYRHCKPYLVHYLRR